jgi:hypothetical protein
MKYKVSIPIKGYAVCEISYEDPTISAKELMETAEYKARNLRDSNDPLEVHHTEFDIDNLYISIRK